MLYRALCRLSILGGLVWYTFLPSQNHTTQAWTLIAAVLFATYCVVSAAVSLFSPGMYTEFHVQYRDSSGGEYACSFTHGEGEGSGTGRSST